jgi:putative two-component system response regulator
VRDVEIDARRYRLLTLHDVTVARESERLGSETRHNIAELSDIAIEQAVTFKHHAEDLERLVAQRTQELRRANLGALWMLAVASEAKDKETGNHVRRVQGYTEKLALKLSVPRVQASDMGYSAILHDVGKIHIPDQVLGKPGPLTAPERGVMQEHTVIGERILTQDRFFALAGHIARSHHENWDGSGYPDGLRGPAIPLAARLVHLADVYDALVSVRPYKPAWPEERAAATIIAERGKAMDPEIVDAFVDLRRQGKWN